jgi:hypothetical protein
MVFSDFWAGRAVTTTLSPKFRGPTQRWGRAGLGEGGAVENHGGEGTRVDHRRWGPAWGGDKWRSHGEGTYNAAACLLPHKQARLVDCSNLVFNFKKFVFPQVDCSSSDFFIFLIRFCSGDLRQFGFLFLKVCFYPDRGCQGSSDAWGGLSDALVEGA